MNHPGQQMSIEIQEGSLAPRYDKKVTELVCTKAVITEKGTEAGLPIVDLQLVDIHGNKFYIMLTGRIVNAVSAVIKGTNMRNYGIEEP